MRHGKHNHTLVATQEHRKALLSNLAAALFTHGRIQTTLAKARGLRPFAEKVITLAKKAQQGDAAKRVHLQRLALTYVRDKAAINLLFNEKAEQFAKRPGGYTRIYKLGNRIGDAAEMALIELCGADDEQHLPRSKRAGAKKATTKKAPAKKETTEEVTAEVATEEAPAAEAAAEEKPAKKPAAKKATKKAEPKAEDKSEE